MSEWQRDWAREATVLQAVAGGLRRSLRRDRRRVPVGDAAPEDGREEVAR